MSPTRTMNFPRLRCWRPTCGKCPSSGIGPPSVLRGERTGGVNHRTRGCVGDVFDQPVEERVELRGSLEVDGLGKVILRAVIAELIPLAIARLGLRVAVVAEN